jgi:uncharacterized protein
MLKKIKKDLIKSIKSNNNEKRDTLRLIMNAVNNYKKSKNKIDDDISDEIIYSLIRIEIKQIKELIAYALKERRVKMLENLGKRLSIFDSYMPSQMSDEDIKKAIYVIAHDLNINPIINRDRGFIIKKAINIMQGKADGPRINKIITKIIKENEDKNYE